MTNLGPIETHLPPQLGEYARDLRERTHAMYKKKIAEIKDAPVTVVLALILMDDTYRVNADGTIIADEYIQALARTIADDNHYKWLKELIINA